MLDRILNYVCILGMLLIVSGIVLYLGWVTVIGTLLVIIALMLHGKAVDGSPPR